MKELLLSNCRKYLSSLLFVSFLFIGATLSAQVVVKGKVADIWSFVMHNVGMTLAPVQN